MVSPTCRPVVELPSSTCAALSVMVTSCERSPIITPSRVVRILVVEAGYMVWSAFFSKITSPVVASMRMAALA